ncbi:nucleotidyltransferase domain-containing protein [Methanoculleus sp.]|uniref:HVO_A0114 family putative DNA-binding protein n=1 Tax=Methanoculleus sp. TaxID=90427 RepID=UPI00320EED1C
MNFIQQPDNHDQQLPDEETQEPAVEGHTPSGNLHPRDFLDAYGSLLRKSSLILLVLLGRDYTRKFHVRELARMVHRDVSLVSKNLKSLEVTGLVTRKDVGNLAFYQGNMESALFRQMKIWFTLLELQALIRDLQGMTTSVILYGSCARGEDTAESDIDLYIEAAAKGPVRETLYTHRSALSREFFPIVNTPDETYRLKTGDAPFFDSIRQGIVLIG